MTYLVTYRICMPVNIFLPFLLKTPFLLQTGVRLKGDTIFFLPNIIARTRSCQHGHDTATHDNLENIGQKQLTPHVRRVCDTTLLPDRIDLGTGTQSNFDDINQKTQNNSNGEFNQIFIASYMNPFCSKDSFNKERSCVLTYQH